MSQHQYNVLPIPENAIVERGAYFFVLMHWAPVGDHGRGMEGLLIYYCESVEVIGLRRM